MAKIGIVLSGGLAKGAYQIGVLKAIDEIVGYENVYMISASSVGVLNAYSFANGQLREAEKIWMEINFDKTKSFVKNVLKGNFIDNCFSRIPPSENLSSKKIYITLLNKTKKTVDYINLQNLPAELCKKFIRASIALPPFNKPMKIKNCKYLDGALADNIPILPIVQQNPDCIICIYFDDYNYKFENNDIDRKIIKITMQSDKFIKNALVFKHEYIEKMILDGYTYGKNILKHFFKDGLLMSSYINDIDEFNKYNQNLNRRVTCDMVMKQVNKTACRIYDKNI